jgi:O-antigen ligase
MSAAIVFLIVFVIYSHVYLYLWAQSILNIMPGLWYLAIICMGLIAGVMSFGKMRDTPEFSPGQNRLNQRGLMVWAAIFFVCAAFSFLFSDRMFPQVRALKTIIVCLGMLGVFMFAIGGEREVRAARYGVFGVVLLSVLNNFLDFTGIYNFSVATGRAAGFYQNPNIAGFYLVTGMVLTASLLPRRLRLYYCLLVGLGVTLTFSRSSVLMWLVSLYGLSQIHIFSFSRKMLTIMWTSLVVMVLAVQFGENMVASLGITKYLGENARVRMQFNYQTDVSVQGRLAVAEESWQLFQQAPWTGHGLGAHNVSSTLVAPHNMFLLIGVEMGVLGLLLYIGLFFAIWRMNAGVAKVFAAAFFIGSLFSHNLLDETALWLALALVAGTAASHASQNGSRSRRSQFVLGLSRPNS